jgi:hypothetical protein
LIKKLLCMFLSEFLRGHFSGLTNPRLQVYH